MKADDPNNSTMASRRAAREAREAAGVVPPPKRRATARAQQDVAVEPVITRVSDGGGERLITSTNVARWSDGRMRNEGLDRV